MAAFVNGFFITPVLRQARRLSERTRQRLAGDTHDTDAAPQQPIEEENVDLDRCGRGGHDDIVAAAAFTEGTTTTNVSPQHISGQQSPLFGQESGLGMAGLGSLSRTAGGVLPEDDGFSVLRRRLQDIQRLSDSPEQKAQLMHRVMMERYLRTQGKTHPGHPARGAMAMATAGRRSPDGALGSSAPADSTGKSWTGSLTVGSALETLKLWPSETQAQQISVSERDREPTYSNIDPDAAPPCAPTDSPPPDLDDLDSLRLGCKHYLRNVKLQCSTCSRWYTCRFCHDEAEDHSLIRKATRNMLCMVCGCAQRASDTCTGCGETTARYYCNVCKLWDDHPDKPIYHCLDCGICRKGLGLGKDFFHCKKCGVCIPISTEASHRCIERSTDCDCPICGDYLFTSPLPVVFMNCGHSIHRDCFAQHKLTSYKCPICNKSIQNMESQFRNMDVAIACQPMPEEYRDTRAVVLCNDCSSRTSVPYHFLGLKCAICRSYNTRALQVIGRAGRTGSAPAFDEQQLAEALARHHINPQDAVDPEPASRAESAHAARSANFFPDADSSSGSDTPALLALGASNAAVRAFLGRGGYGVASPMTHDDSDDDIIGFWGPHSDSERDAAALNWDGLVSEHSDDDDSSQDEALQADEGSDYDEDDDLFLFGHR